MRNMLDLQVRLRKRCLALLHMFAGHLHQLLAMRHRGSRGADRVLRPEGRARQSQRTIPRRVQEVNSSAFVPVGPVQANSSYAGRWPGSATSRAVENLLRKVQ